MQELEKILKEIDETIEQYKENANIVAVDICYGMNIAKKIIRKHMNDGWIPVEDRLPEKNEYFADISSNREFPNGELYTTGEQRTGCMFCAFGAHLEAEPNRFQRMAITHPKHYQACMNLQNNGVTYRYALEYCGIATETWEQVGQMGVDDFI